jgi:hypothetical protein
VCRTTTTTTTTTTPVSTQLSVRILPRCRCRGLVLRSVPFGFESWLAAVSPLRFLLFPRFTYITGGWSSN